MKILVTGADGFTGKHFVAHAQQAGYEVHELKADLTNPSALVVEVLDAAPNLVVHLAAISFVAHADVDALYKVNVVGTTNLLDALCSLPSPPQRVLIASSANIYGNTEASPIEESMTPFPINHYATSKLAMEFMAKTYLDRLAIFFTRPFNYIGVGQADFFVIPKIVKHFRQRAPYIELGNLDVEREFNDVRFVCDAYLKLLKDASVGESYNICSGKPYPLKVVLDLLTEMTSHSLEVRTNPEFVRINEIKRLFGNPAKLFGVVGEINEFTLRETLHVLLSQPDEA